MYTVFRSREGVDPGFLYRLLKSSALLAQYKLHEQASVNRRGAIGFPEFANIRVQLPKSLDEQLRIAEILDAADREIDDTNRSLAKWKTTKLAIWQDLCAHVEAHAFKLGQLLSQRPQNGYSPVEATEATGVYTLGLGCLTSNGFAPRQIKPIPARDPAVNRVLLSDGDLLISRSNTPELVGLAGRYQDIGKPCIYPDLMMRLKPKDGVPSKFLELALRSVPLRRQIQAAAQGTSGSMVKISAATVRNLDIMLPTPREQHRIVQAMGLLDDMEVKLQVKLNKLRLLLEGLMSDLLSGKVRFSATFTV